MRRLFVLPALLFALPAGATLQVVDLFAPGDGLLTRESDTGLDWLDPTTTQNQSYNSIATGAGGWTTGPPLSPSWPTSQIFKGGQWAFELPVGLVG